MADSLRLHRRPDLSRERSARAFGGLIALVAGTVALGVALWWLNGSPQVPSSSPDWSRIANVLSGSHLPDEDAIDIATGLGWLALAYLAATLFLRVTSQVMNRMSAGAWWAGAALHLSDLITLPPVRWVVDGALTGTILVAMSLPTAGATRAHASSELSISVAAASPPPSLNEAMTDTVRDGAYELVAHAPVNDVFVSYTVVDGDNLWDISRRFYGDGTLYTVIFHANEGRVMTTGEALTNPRLVRPGWILDIPMPGYHVWATNNHVMYRVRPDDSLWRISESFLGDPLRWTEIWRVNGDREMVGGIRFTNPSHILPGWVLELPIEAVARPVAPPVGPAEQPPPVATTPTAAPELLAPRETLAAPPASATPVYQPESKNGAKPWDSPAPSTSVVLAAAAGLAAAGGVALVVRHTARRNSTGPVRLSTRHQRPGKRHTAGDVGKVVLAARALLRGLRELGFDDLRLVLVREAERFLEFTLDCAPGDADAAVRSRYALGRRLACVVTGEVASPTRIRFKVSSFQRLAGMLFDDGLSGEPLLLGPTGADDAGVHYLNLAAVGSLLVVGREDEAWRAASTWVMTLGAIHSPEQLVFLTAGGVRSRLGDSASLPHFAMGTQEVKRSLDDLVAELEESIVAREAAVPGTESRAAIVALAAVSADSAAEIDRLETVVRRGPEHGIFAICVAAAAGESPVLGAFGARLTFGAAGMGPDECVLSMGREIDVTLSPVQVRTQPLPPMTRRDDHGAGHVDEPLFDDAALRIEDDREEDIQVEEAPLTTDDRAADDRPPPEAEAEVPTKPASDPAEPPTMQLSPAQGSRQAALLVADEDAAIEEVSTNRGTIFSVRCFGSFHIQAGGREITKWKIQKARELLAYLVARGGTPVPRDEAAEALWPDEPAATVEHMLSNAAYYLRRALKSVSEATDTQACYIDNQRYHLRSGMLRVDVDAFDAHLRRAEALAGTEALGEYGRAVALYRDDFLRSEPFEWAEVYRREYRRRFVEAAHKAARLAVECRDDQKAIEFYDGILAHDPIDEKASRGLMRCRAKAGDVNGVRRVYKMLCESLQSELEDEKAEPLSETTALLQELTQ